MAQHTSKQKPIKSGSLKMPGYNESLGEKSKISYSEDKFRQAANSLLPDWERRTTT